MAATTTPRAISHHVVAAPELQLGDHLYTYDYAVGVYATCPDHRGKLGDEDGYGPAPWTTVATLSIDCFDGCTTYVGTRCGCQLVCDGYVSVERARAAR